MNGNISFHFDEHLSSAIVKGLRQRGIEVTTVGGASEDSVRVVALMAAGCDLYKARAGSPDGCYPLLVLRSGAWDARRCTGVLLGRAACWYL